ncbi:MAG TPA: potassium channel protein [Terriglobales bacterium]|nr:potassium channel protein [Terriglobales bacterium]
MPSAPIRGLRNLRVIIALLFVHAVIATFGFHFIEGWTWFDALYMVVTTITTIGYREVHELSAVGRAFNLYVILVGVGLLFLAIGALASALLEFELRKFFGRRRMEREISRLTNHVIICGAGRVGRSVARELLMKPAPFLIIENSSEKVLKLNEKWLLLSGDATQEQTLKDARVEYASGLVAAATTDAINLYIVLTARSLNPKLKIIARASEEDAEKHLRKAGADIVISPYTFAGHRIAQSFLRPNVIDFLDLATASDRQLDLELAEVKVEAGAPFVGKTLAGSQIRQTMNIIVLAIKKREGMHFNPEPDDKIEAGDYLIAMGEPGGLRRLQESASAKTALR